MKAKLAVILICVLAGPAVLGQAAKSGFIKTSDGTRIHYLEAGSGRPIVLIPGWTMPAWIWQPQIEEFSTKYHVIAVDPRSQGESDKPSFGHLQETRARDYKELVDQLGLKQPVLVGWSMGTAELVKYIAQFGNDNVAGLVFVDGFLQDQFSPEMFNALSGWMNQLQQDRTKQADGFIRHMFKKPHPEEYIQKLIAASIQVPADTAALLIYNMMAVKDYPDGLAKIERPVLCMYQPESQPIADLVKAKLGDKVKVARYSDDGHALFVDDPTRFNRLVDEFMQSLPK